MAALDFPNAPVNGQLFPAPNGVIYQWTGVLWAPFGTTALPGLAAAPTYDTFNIKQLLDASYTIGDNVMQITQGTQIFNRSYTANDPTRPIEVDCDLPFGAGGAAVWGVVGLFVDGAAPAVAQEQTVINTQWGAFARLRWQGVLGAGAHTFQIRCGGSNGQGAYILGTDNYRLGGGAARCVLTIREIGQGAQGPVGPQGPAGNPGQGARAWANFTNGAVINGSFNVASVTKVAGGQYWVNFTTPPPNVNYSCFACTNGGPGIMTNSYPDPNNLTRAVVVSANSVTQGYQDGNPYTFSAFW